MKISREWLEEYVDLTGVTDEKISEALNLSGSENEVKKSSAALLNVVVGEIRAISDHPDADKLRVTKTFVGEKHGGELQIVCGAPNIEVGQKVPVALVGASFGELKIKKAKIRGVESFGMLCSEAELGISDDHQGIMILESARAVGESFEENQKSESIFEFEITPNRSDCFSVIGIARELAASLGKKVKQPIIEKVKLEKVEPVRVKVEDGTNCPRYMARRITNITIKPSPEWLQSRLIAAGVRPISNIVDVTNYVMLEWGQPLHAFDALKITEPIVVRKANHKEKIVTLDGATRELDGKNLLITDARGPIALAGVMGGENSEVSEDTKEIILEAAVFNGTNVRKTAQKFALRTEASNRYEKGVSLKLPEVAIERAAELLLAVAGGKASENTDILSSWIYLQRVGMRLSRLNKFMGIKFKQDFVEKTLSNLGFAFEKFEIKKEARRHVGKPYIWSASYKTHGDMAFDCSYLTDYIFSKIGKFIGHTALAQYMLGQPVDEDELAPGDLLFLKGEIDKSVTDHYYVPDGSGANKKVVLEKPVEVGHVALYIGDGRIVHASHYDYDKKTKKWTSKSKDSAKVTEEPAENFLNHPEYLGARRHVSDINDWLAIEVPWWRLDIKTEQDIFEEIGRIYGYDNLPSSLPEGDLPVFAENRRFKLVQNTKHIMKELGFSEFYNYSFVSEKIAAVSPTSEKLVEVENPVSPDGRYLRSSLAGSMITSAVKNQENYDLVNGFEIAPVFLGAKDLPKENMTLGIFISGNASSSELFHELKGALSHLAKRWHLPALNFAPLEFSFIETGTGAELLLGNQKVGYLGVVRGLTAREFGLKQNLALSEINLEKLKEIYGKPTVFEPLPKYPVSKRDINVVVPSTVLVSDILGAIGQLPSLVSTEVVDIYESKGLSSPQGGLPEGKKSVTIRLVLGAIDRTLKEEEIQHVQRKVLEILAKKVEANLRKS